MSDIPDHPIAEYRVRTKVCGITRVEDVEVAAKAGADALGFVFYPPSPRSVSIAQAEQLMRAVPPFVTTVGLFVNPCSDWVWEVIDQLPIDLLQFHGDESGEFCSQFHRPYIKAARMGRQSEQKEGITALLAAHPEAMGFLLDAYDPEHYGGTGQTFDWSIWPEPRQCSSVPLILAGGLSADNVAQAIGATQPYAVDVSSGVEGETKGCKEADKIDAFIRAVHHEHRPEIRQMSEALTKKRGEQH